MRRIASCSRTRLRAVFAHNVGADVDDWQTSIDAVAMGYFRAPIRARGAGPGVASAPVRRGDAGGAGACAEPIRRVRRFGRRRRGRSRSSSRWRPSASSCGCARPPAASSTRPLARAVMASGMVRRGPPAGWPAAAAWRGPSSAATPRPGPGPQKRLRQRSPGELGPAARRQPSLEAAGPSFGRIAGAAPSPAHACALTSPFITAGDP
jgi:hypothetical protein